MIFADPSKVIITKPFYDSTTNDTTVQSGATVSLKCQVENPPVAYDVQWAICKDVSNLFY